jgi:hypothetical protein
MTLLQIPAHINTTAQETGRVYRVKRRNRQLIVLLMLDGTYD